MTGLILRLSHHDERLLLALLARRRGMVDAVMRRITHLGGAAVSISAAVLLLLNGRVEIAHCGARAAFTLIVSHLAVQILKHAIERPRPRLPVGLSSLVRAPDRFSFPSGHAAASLAIALPLAGLLPILPAAALIALALAVGFSRCYLGVHYPGDIAMGWALAATAFWLAEPALSLLTHLR